MKIGVLGAGGRMGRMVIRELLSGQYEAELGAAIEREGSPFIGEEAGKGFRISDEKVAAFRNCDVMIDFTTPEACTTHALLADQHKKPLVVGTTGLGEVEEAALIVASKKAPVFYTANMSLGVNLMMTLVEQVAGVLDERFDIEIYEAHHRQKIDAPSGTALALGRAAAKGRGVKLDDAMVPARFGHIGPRVPGSIGMSVFRGGDVVGEHTVTFAGMGESLSFTHKATDRAIFAKGALKAAVWLNGKKPGTYSMKDMLGG
jgi:4-hydroxy-tetrahydrodipicolinate reductase